jgi:hypothetical protein
MTTVNCFWHGTFLSLLEKLTLKSFLANGYDVKLWRYNTDLDIECPWGISVCDANEIIPEDQMFFYTGEGDCRKGSLGGFSDLFRYMLVDKVGGVYVDMDNTCLAPYDFSADYVIKPHATCGTVANILKAPSGCDFLKTCIEQTKKQIDSKNNSWVKPVEIFNEAVITHNLQEFIVPNEFFGCDNYEDLYTLKNGTYLKDKDLLPEYIVHWCKENSYGRWASRDLYNWDRPRPLTIYYNLLLDYGLL